MKDVDRPGKQTEAELRAYTKYKRSLIIAIKGKQRRKQI